MGALFGFIFKLGFIGAIIFGYVNNILKLIDHTGGWAGLQLVQAVGMIVPPIGIIMGFVG